MICHKGEGVGILEALRWGMAKERLGTTALDLFHFSKRHLKSTAVIKTVRGCKVRIGEVVNNNVITLYGVRWVWCQTHRGDHFIRIKMSTMLYT